MSDLQRLSHTIQDLQRRIGSITRERAKVDSVRANCQVQINKLRNIQAGLKNQASPGQLSLSFSPVQARLNPNYPYLSKLVR
jgi:hypothetical protein